MIGQYLLHKPHNDINDLVLMKYNDIQKALKISD